MMKKISIVVMCTIVFILSAGEFENPEAQPPIGVPGNPPLAETNKKNGMFERINAFFDHATTWLNPLFECPLNALPVISLLYPSSKGYIKGLTIAGVLVVLIRSRPIQSMVKTVKEWYEDYDMGYCRTPYHEVCHHPCLICSVDKKK